MIFYPFQTLIDAEINDVLIITNPEDLNLFEKLFKDYASDNGINISFKVQKEPNGIAEAFIIGEHFIQNDDVCLILGDNLFFNSKAIHEKKLIKPSKIFVKEVKNPNRYGVLEIQNNEPILIHEKPKENISNYIVVGIYMYNNSVINKVKNLKPSNRGELEITDLNNLYLKKEDCEIVYMEKNSVWFDSGDFDSLLNAANFVSRNNIS